MQTELAEFICATHILESSETQTNDDEQEQGYQSRRSEDWEIGREDAELIVLFLNNWIKLNHEASDEYEKTPF